MSIASGQFDDLPDGIRARMSIPFSPSSTVSQLKRAAFETFAEYRDLILDASENKPVDPVELQAKAAASGRTQLQVFSDLDDATRAYVAWRMSINF